MTILDCILLAFFYATVVYASAWTVHVIITEQEKKRDG